MNLWRTRLTSPCQRLMAISRSFLHMRDRSQQWCYAFYYLFKQKLQEKKAFHFDGVASLKMRYKATQQKKERKTKRKRATWWCHQPGPKFFRTKKQNNAVPALFHGVLSRWLTRRWNIINQLIGVDGNLAASPSRLLPVRYASTYIISMQNAARNYLFLSITKQQNMIQTERKMATENITILFRIAFICSALRIALCDAWMRNQ